jgi:outer membrane protein assembly factor BamB
MWRSLSVVLLSVALAGCQTLRGTSKDNVDPPAELVAFQTTAPLQRAWTGSVGEGEGRLGLRQAVTVGDGRVFTASVNGTVAALASDSGRQLWRNSVDLRLSSSPGFGEGTLVIGSLDGQVVALNPENGNERWRARVSSEVITRAAISRGVAVVRSYDGRVFGFSITDGTRRWVYDRGLPALTLRGNGVPVIAGGVVYVGYESGDVVAIRLEDGVLQWEQRIGEAEGRTEIERMVDVDGEMVATGGEVYASSYKGQVVSLDPASGRPLWNRDLVSYSGVALAGERLLVSDRAGTVWALDRRTGTVIWRQDGLAHRWLTTPAVHGGYAVVGDLEGYLHWLSLDTGEFAARERPSNKAIRATPQVAEGMLHAVAVDGKLAAYRLTR